MHTSGLDDVVPQAAHAASHSSKLATWRVWGQSFEL